MADQGRTRNVTLYRTTNLCLVLILAYGILCIAIFLLVKGAVCSTTSPGIDFSLGFSVPTIVVVGLRCYLIFRQRQKLQTISPSPALPRLDSACGAGVQCLMFLWMILACCNLLVALRAPICRSQPLAKWQDNLVENNWKYGPSCRLHRVVVALSIMMALSVCSLSLFDNIDRQQKYHGSSFFCCWWRLSRKSPKHKPNTSICSSASAFEVDKDDRLFLVPERRPSRLEHEQWLQRRNSLSSQRAIYPHRSHYFDPRARYGIHSYAPSSGYSRTLRSVSEGVCLDLDDRSSSISSSQSSNSLARSSRPSTLSSRSRASSSPDKMGERGMKGTRPGLAPEPAPVPVPDLPPLPMVPAPAWSPSLHHAPLSADPTIRALSTGVGARNSLRSRSKSTPALGAQAASPTTWPARIQTQTQKQTPAQAAALERAQAQANMSAGPPFPPPTIPPPPPPPAPFLSSSPSPSHFPIPPITSTPTLGSIPLAIPTRSPGHPALPRSTTQTSTKTATSGPNLCRPSPTRRRHNQHQHQHQHQRQSQHAHAHHHPYQHPRGSHHSHQRGWRRYPSSVRVSVYSASSYATERAQGLSSLVQPLPVPVLVPAIAR